MSWVKERLLARSVADIQAWLARFYPPQSGRQRRALLGPTGEFIVVKAFPLPDGYAPDEIDVMLIVDNFPSLPPIGVYVLNEGTGQVLAQLRQRFNVFRDRTFHEAHTVPNYTWICYQYVDNRWRFNAKQINRGDNLSKFLANFFADAA